MGGDLWLQGTFSNYSGGEVGVSTTVYTTPTKVVTGNVVASRVTKDNTFYLLANGELWTSGWNYAAGLGASHTNGVWTLVTTGVDAIFNTDAWDGNIIYRKGTEYWCAGYCYPSLMTSLGKATNFNAAPGRITSLSGMNIVSISGGEGECYCAIDAAGNAYICAGSGGDQGGLTSTVWTSNGWMDDGLFHLSHTPTQWSGNSLVGNAFESAFMGIPQTPSGSLHVSGEELDMFVGYPLPAKATVATRPTLISGAYGTMGDGINRTPNGLPQINLLNYVNFYVSGGELYAHKGAEALSGPYSTGGVTWLGLIGGVYLSSSGTLAIGTRAGAIVVGSLSYSGANPIAYTQVLDTASYPELDGTSFLHAAAGQTDVGPTYIYGAARAFVISPAPLPIDFWENTTGVEQV